MLISPGVGEPEVIRPGWPFILCGRIKESLDGRDCPAVD
jgi:hypothetical protein